MISKMLMIFEMHSSGVVLHPQHGYAGRQSLSYLRDIGLWGVWLVSDLHLSMPKVVIF